MSEDAYTRRKINQTSITIWLKKRQKDKWQRYAEILTDGNLSQLIKKSVQNYVENKIQLSDINTASMGSLSEEDSEEIKDIMYETMQLYKKIEQKLFKSENDGEN